MPVPPPVPAAQRYPLALRDFLTYEDQPGGSDNPVTTPNPYPPPPTVTTDLTLDAAAVTRDLITEILSLESTIGIRPFTVPGQLTLGGSVVWLFNNKSPGRADPATGNIPPTPPPSHNHDHTKLSALTHDDHPQYMLVNGARPFTSPVTASRAQAGTQLITLFQAKAAGLNSTQVETIIQETLAAHKDSTEGVITGPDSRRWKMTGGQVMGFTDINGNIFINFAPARFSGILTLVLMRMPYPLPSYWGYGYQYEEDQLILQTLTTAGAWIQFREDIIVDRQAWVCFNWLALGI